jgi:quercetin dioxygenase-like cupin family protein
MTVQATDQPADSTLLVRADEGEALWWFSSLAVVKATAADTGGRLTVLDITDPPGEQTPRFISHTYDMAYWILDGTVLFEVEGAPVEARPGDLIFVPRGVPQQHTAGPEGCRWLSITLPGGLEDLASRIAQPAATRALPRQPAEARDPEQLLAIGAEHGMQPVDGV